MRLLIKLSLAILITVCLTGCSNSNSSNNSPNYNNNDYTDESTDYTDENTDYTYESSEYSYEFYNTGSVWSYLTSNSFTGEGITLRFSDSYGITANGHSIGRVPEIITFNERMAEIRYSSHNGGYVTLWVDCGDGTITSAAAEIFYKN